MAFPVRWGLYDVTDLPYSDDSFDAVILCNVLHLLLDPGRALAEAERVLRPGGTLLASTYCWGEGPRLRGTELLFRLVGVRVHNPWSAEEYRRFLESAGLTVHRFEILTSRPPLVYTAGAYLP